MFPPGRARFVTKPPPTGSETETNTSGIVCVAFRTIAAAGFAQTTMMSQRQLDQLLGAAARQVPDL